MVAGNPPAHNTLEAIPQQSQYQADVQSMRLPSDPGKQVAPGLGLESVAREDFPEHWTDVPAVPSQRISKKTRMMFYVGITVLLILAAAIGGIFGFRQKKKFCKKFHNCIIDQPCELVCYLSCHANPAQHCSGILPLEFS